MQPVQPCINITIKYLRCYEVQPCLWQVPTFSVRDGIRTSLLEHPKNHSLRSASSKQCLFSFEVKYRTKIKGTLVFNEGGGIHRLGSILSSKFESHYVGGFQKK